MDNEVANMIERELQTLNEKSKSSIDGLSKDDTQRLKDLLTLQKGMKSYEKSKDAAQKKAAEMTDLQIIQYLTNGAS